MGFDQEQDAIIREISELKESQGRKWNKFRGDITNRLIIEYLKPHVDNYGVIGPSAYVNGTPTEFDILIVRRGARLAVPHSNCYERSDTKLIIEIKKHGFYYTKLTAVEEIRKYIQPFEHAELPWIYLTIAESKKMWNATREVMGDKSFCLSTSPKMTQIDDQWRAFVERVKTECRSRTSRLAAQSHVALAHS